MGLSIKKNITVTQTKYDMKMTTSARM